MNKSTSRTSLKEIGNKDDLMAKYLSKADEFTAPPGGRVFNSYSHESDMSLIAEQSMIDEEFYNAHPLVSVDETIAEISPIEAAPAQPLSKLPQRVLMYSEPKPVSINTTPAQEISSDTSKSETIQKELKGKEAPVKEKDYSDKEKEKSRSKSNRQNDEKSIKEKESGKIKDKKGSKMKEKGNESEASLVTDGKVKRMENDKTLDGKDNNIDGDISAFGFGGNFAADLVSGSPITAEKRRETFVLQKQSSDPKVKTKEKENKRKETFVKPQAFPETGTKGKKNVVKTNSVKNSMKDNKSVKPKFDTTSSKMKRRETYATENPFVPKSANIQRSPQKPLNEEGMGYDTVENPFKPTKTLLRSPVHINVESASPEKKVDSLAFLARFRESLEKRPAESSPLPEPIFSDEPTTYFNSEMEFTSVIDSTKLLQTLRGSEKNSPINPMESITDSDDHTDSANSKSATSSATEKDTKSQHESVETAAVEVRTKKPGVFTFSVGRKEADGSRKPVPEKISKARSKKKKAVTPEKEERKTGSDRDMFNFGDRTPTMPLDKLAAKTKNVYDLSMNESVAAAPVSFNSFKDKKNVPEPLSDGQVYYAPLKGCSPDENPSSKRAKSQSRSRSKSRKNEDDDDDWVPGGKSRGRSKSRSRKTDDEQTTVRRGRSQSRKRAADKAENDEIEEVKSRGRSKSRSRKNEKEEITEKTNRSKSTSKPEDSNEDFEEEEKQSLSKRCRSRSRGRVLKDETKGENHDKEEIVEIENEQAEIVTKSREKIENRSGRSKSKQPESENGEELHLKEVRRGRSRSRARHKIEDSGLDANRSKSENAEHTDLELCNSSAGPRRSGRSKSQIRKPINDDDSDVDESPVLQRKSRSRSMRSRKTFEIKNDELDNELEGKGEKLAGLEKSEDASIIVVLDSDKSDESSNKENSEHFRKASCDELEAKIVETESDSEKVEKIEHRRSRRHVKSICHDNDDDDDDNSPKKNSESKSKNKKSENKRIKEDNIEEKIGRHLDFINKRRGKALKITDDEDCENKEVGTGDKIEKSISNCLNDVEIIPESPLVIKKPEEKKSTKSTKKSTKKRKAAEPEKTGKSRMNIADKLDNEEIEKSSVTPAALPETVKKSSKTSGRSTKKAKVERLPEQTPVLKEDKSKSQPSAIALLKKRLTMVGNKHLVKEDSNTEVRKRSQAELDGHNDGCESPEKRSRRNKNPVSYVTKPLNVKLRQGDDMFQDTGTAMSKVKAEQSRLLIAKKTSVPKVSVDDKENVMQTWAAT
ncbi:serine/arginine repetitive matrix protein 2-like [Ruditapes philippinarum]|uniref:serine/arginine repetitive matrix protein 2-like n=1 Tax=Ruditapes philippinarum TaxID=129788 RepID=UPI00295A84C8|nr:serine/arginine repetitive matrix protein 2-like [Ruditapes philippinarum]